MALLFQNFPLFERTPPLAREQLSALARILSKSRGHRLVEEGAPLTYLYFFLQGGAQAFTEWESKRVLHRILHQGQVYGLGLFQVQSTSLLTVDLLTPGTVALVPVEGFKAWLERWPVAWADVARAVAREAISMAEFYPKALHGSVAQRLALLFRRVAEGQEDDTEFTIRLNQTVLADLIGSTREKLVNQCRGAVSEGSCSSAELLQNKRPGRVYGLTSGFYKDSKKSPRIARQDELCDSFSLRHLRPPQAICFSPLMARSSRGPTAGFAAST